MAGSYRHCTTDQGQFTFELIENMGDAHEACEMMWHMINHLAGTDRAGGGSPAARMRIEAAQTAYYGRARGDA